MNAHKKSKSSGNPGPRSSNLQLWMSKARVRTAETLTPLSKNTFFYLYFEFLSNYFLAVCPFHIPPISCKSCCISPRLFARKFLTSLAAPNTSKVLTGNSICAFTENGLRAWIDGMERRFSKVSAVDLNLAGRMSSLQLSNFHNFHLSLDVIQCHPVIPFHHQVSCSQAVRGRSRCLRSNQTDCRISSSNITTIKSQIFEAKYSKDF